MNVSVSTAVNVNVSHLHDEHRTRFMFIACLPGSFQHLLLSHTLFHKEWNGEKLARSKKEEAFSWKGGQGSVPHLVQRTGISFSLSDSNCLTYLKCCLQVGLAILLWLLPLSSLGWMSKKWRMWFRGTECGRAALAMSHWAPLSPGSILHCLHPDFWHCWAGPSSLCYCCCCVGGWGRSAFLSNYDPSCKKHSVGTISASVLCSFSLFSAQLCHLFSS